MRASALLLVTSCGAAVTPSDIQRAATERHLPHVVACWEQAFEGNGFVGEYQVTADFSVDGSGAVFGARVTEAVDVTSGDPTPLGDGGAFASCVTAALNQERLALSGPLSVTGYRIAFTDPSRAQRERAASQTSSMLVGPRSDRCQGMYAHEPPRDAGLLHRLLSEARAAADAADDDRDKRARAAQRAFDLALEIHHRLERDAREADPPSRKRLLQELKRIDKARAEIGRTIGCR